jgi:hypothetical protein
MIEAGMQADLCAQLIHHFVLEYLALHDFLNCSHETCLMVPAQEDLPEFALAEVGAQLEAIDKFRLLLQGLVFLDGELFLRLALDDLVQRLEGLLLLRITRGLADA